MIAEEVKDLHEDWDETHRSEPAPAKTGVLEDKESVAAIYLPQRLLSRRTPDDPPPTP
jgi:hypothetical protein